jgi:membrane-associated phospholipid phosphatase
VNLRRALWTWLIAIALGGLILIAAFRLDPAVHNWQRKYRFKNITVLSRNVKHATDWPAHFIVGLSFAAIAWWRGSEKWTRIFLAMVIAGALAGTTAYALKFATGRVRPSVKVEKIWSGPSVRQNFQSFPSGHTAVTTGFFGVLFLASWRIGLRCLPIPLFVAFTRIFLGAHYFSDVVAAALLGILAAYLVTRLIVKSIPDQQSAISN